MPETPTLSVDEPPVALSDNIRMAVFDVSAMRERYPEWDTLSTAEKKRRCRQHEPRYDGTTHNITCIGLHRYIPKLLNHKRDPDIVRDNAAQIALGTDAAPAGGFSVTDTELSNEVGRTDLTDPSDTDDTWGFSEYLSSVELNGHTLREMGVVSENDVLWNHAELPRFITKDSNTAIIFDGAVPVGDQSEV